MANQTHIAADSSTSGWEPTVQDQINLSLATNGGIKRIEAVMQQRLDEAGWTQSLKEYVTKLLRSGEASTYDECLAKVMAAVNGKEGVNGVNGAGGAGQAPNLKMPDDAMQDAAAAVKKEIAPLLVEKNLREVMQRSESVTPSSVSPKEDLQKLLDDVLSEYPELPEIDLGDPTAATLSQHMKDPAASSEPNARSSNDTYTETSLTALERGLQRSRKWTDTEDARLRRLKLDPATAAIPYPQLVPLFNNRSEDALRSRWNTIAPAAQTRSTFTHERESLTGDDRSWTAEEDRLLIGLKTDVRTRSTPWPTIARLYFPTRNVAAVTARWATVRSRSGRGDGVA